MKSKFIYQASADCWHVGKKEEKEEIKDKQKNTMAESNYITYGILLCTRERREPWDQNKILLNQNKYALIPTRMTM